MGLTFIIGLFIYLLIIVTLMVWFLKYHSRIDRSKSEFFLDQTDSFNQKNLDSSFQQTIFSQNRSQSGVQSVSKKSEVLPEDCNQQDSSK